jgi:hypothetical protein
MKIAVECRSPLLQKSLEIFLGKYLSSIKKCDIVVRDTVCLNDEKCFYIANSKDADLIKPFSKSQLILALEEKYKIIHNKGIDDETLRKSLDFSILERRIQYLTTEYQQNILKAVRAFYEK